MFGHIEATIAVLRLGAGEPASAVAPITGGRCVWLIEADSAEGLTDDQREWMEEITAPPFNHQVIVGDYQALSDRAAALILEEQMALAWQNAELRQ